jgi:hypothetical protein
MRSGNCEVCRHPIHAHEPDGCETIVTEQRDELNRPGCREPASFISYRCPCHNWRSSWDLDDPA